MSSAKISKNNLNYYFDSVECDQRCKTSTSRKMALIQDIKSRLLLLSDSRFEEAVKTIANILEMNPNPEPKDSDAAKKKLQAELNGLNQ